LPPRKPRSARRRAVRREPHRHCEERSDEAIQSNEERLDYFVAFGPRNDGNNFFIIFVDAIFTTSFERLFTKSFDGANANTSIP
jgi:hypothetical protein